MLKDIIIYKKIIFLFLLSISVMLATKSFIYFLISLFLYILFYKNNYIKKDKKLIRMVELVISVFISASFIDFDKISNLFLKFLLFILFSVSIFYLVKGISNWLVSANFCLKDFKNSSLQENFLYFFILFSIWIFYFSGFFPGIISPDSLNQWEQVCGVLPYKNEHPIFHTLLLKLSKDFTSSTWLLIFCQIIFSSLIMATIIGKLGYFGVNRKIRLLIALIIGIFSLNGFYMNTVWKDIPFSVSFLFFSFLFLLAVYSKGELIFEKLTYIFFFIFFAFLSVEFRKNAIPVVFIIFGFLCFKISRKYLKRLIFSCISVFLLIISFNFFVEFKYNLQPSNNSEGMAIFFQQIGAIEKFSPQGVSKDSQKIFLTIEPMEVWKTYEPFSSDNLKLYPHINNKFINENMSKIFYHYLKTVIQNPKIAFRAYLDITSNIWRYNVSRDYPFFSITGTQFRDSLFDNMDMPELDSIYRTMYSNFKHFEKSSNKLNYEQYVIKVKETREFLKLNKTNVKNKEYLLDVGGKLLWGSNAWYYPFCRGSFYLILLLLIQIPIYKKYGFNMNCSCLPIWLYLGTLLLTIPAPDTRYFYPLILFVPFMIVICLFGDAKGERVCKNLLTISQR
ncbi:MAG: DUF6020 family protein [Streptococcaceae bacterium]|jgi:hypothetical protein|nr:DUF6020 family protein [Streptococcaceae bacterium]